MRDRMMRFMSGRYGSDPLNQAMMFLSVLLFLVSIFWSPIYILALALMVGVLFRMFSRNIAKRQAEGAAFERLRARVVRFFTNTKNLMFGTKTHRYYKCPSCKQVVRVPRGRGKISIHCPKCQTDFAKKT